MMKKIILLTAIFALTALAVFPFQAMALTAKSGDSIIQTEPVEGNFFAAGNTVTVSNTINGDVFVAANSVNINSTINGDVFAVANNIDINGDINGSLRLLASNINIKSKIENNVLAAGAVLMIDLNSEIGGHVSFVGSSLVSNGSVLGQFDSDSDNATINGLIIGDASLNIRKGRLKLLPQTEINGNLNYSSEQKLDIQPGALVGGDIKYNPDRIKIGSQRAEQEIRRLFKTFFLGFRLARFFSLLIIGLIIISLIPKPLKRIHQIAMEKFWSCIGIGVLVLILAPIISFVLMATLIALPLGLIILVLYLVMICISRAIAAIVFGRLVADTLKWKLPSWASFVIGLILIQIITLVPIFGWLLGLIVLLWALGSLAFYKQEVLKKIG